MLHYMLVAIYYTKFFICFHIIVLFFFYLCAILHNLDSWALSPLAVINMQKTVCITTLM
jgi:hypothetical protein